MFSRKKSEQAIPKTGHLTFMPIRTNDLIHLFSDFIDTYLYMKPSLKLDNSWSRFLGFNNANVIKDNETFWSGALARSIRDGTKVILKGFVVTEWVPLSPGRFFTQEAQLQRGQAKRYFDFDKFEYIPTGKRQMILGGVGSLRLSSKQLADGRFFFMGASRSGASHEGVPVCVPEEIADELQDCISQWGAAECDIEGAVRVLPKTLSVFQHDANIPRFAVFATKVTLRAKRVELEPSVSVAVAFARRDEGEYLSQAGLTSMDKSWCYASFDPRKAQEALPSAVAWITGYVRRHGNGNPILFDFDEIYDHFPKQVEFSLKNLFNKKMDKDLLSAYASGWGVTINVDKLVMGDVFESVNDAVIINRSNIGQCKMLPHRLNLQIAELVNASGLSNLVVFYDEIAISSSFGHLLNTWCKIASELKTTTHALRAEAITFSICYFIGGSNSYLDRRTLLRLVEIAFAVGATESDVFIEFIRYSASIERERRFTAWLNVRNTFPDLFQDTDLDNQVAAELIPLKHEVAWIDPRRLLELGALITNNTQLNVDSYFDPLLNHIRNTEISEAKIKITSICNIIPAVPITLQKYILDLCKQN